MQITPYDNSELACCPSAIDIARGEGGHDVDVPADVARAAVGQLRVAVHHL